MGWLGKGSPKKYALQEICQQIKKRPLLFPFAWPCKIQGIDQMTKPPSIYQYKKKLLDCESATHQLYWSMQLVDMFWSTSHLHVRWIESKTSYRCHPTKLRASASTHIKAYAHSLYRADKADLSFPIPVLDSN